MSSLQSKASEITIYSYDLIRDDSSGAIKKIYLQKIVTEHTVSVRQLTKILTPQNTALFSRPIFFLKKADIHALPSAFQSNGWARFFEAMYFTVSGKNCPASMSPQERDSKTVDLEETIRILTELSTDPVTDPHLLPLVNNTLGILYNRALGIARDLSKAFSYFELAAKGGLAQAHIYLGIFYGNGLIVQKDIHTAIAHFKIAMNSGSIEALYQLGNLFCLEKEKIEKSLPYFTAAAQKKHPTALFWLGYLAVEQAKSKSLSKKEKMNLERKAVEHYREAAQLDCVAAQLDLGQAHVFGYLGLPKKNALALKYFTSATQNRSSEGAGNLGTLYVKSCDPIDNQYETAITYFLKACRYNPANLEKTVTTINKLLRHLANSPSKEAYAIASALSKRVTSYGDKHHLFISSEAYPLAPLSKKNITDQPPQLDNAEAIKNLVTFGQTARSYYRKTLSAEEDALFLAEESERLERTKDLVENFIPILSYFCDLYSVYIERHGAESQSVDFLTFASTTSTWRPAAQHHLLSRLYCLNARDIFYIHKILGKMYFFSHLVSALPFHRWEDKKLVTTVHMRLLNYYLQIMATEVTDIGKLADDPVTTLNHLINTCYWDMCQLLTTAKEQHHKINSLERIMIIAVTYSMIHRQTNPQTQQLLIEAFLSQVLNCPALKEESIHEFDLFLNQYQNNAPVTLETIIALGITNIHDALPIATKALKNHSHINDFKIKSAAIVAFFNERYAHFHAAKLEAERKAKEEAQALKAKEKAEKEAALRKILKEKVLKSQKEILEKLQKDIDAHACGESKTRALQEDLGRLQTLHQETIAFATYSQTLKDKFLKTHRKIQALIAMEPSMSPANPPLMIELNTQPVSSSPDKTNMKSEVLQLLEEREALKSKKEIESTLKKEERAQARATKRADYVEAHTPQIEEPTLPSLPEPVRLDSIESFQDKTTENIFTSQSDQYAGKAVFLLNLINRSKSITEIRSQITHGQNLEPLIGHALKVKGVKNPLQQYSLRVNDKYRITFYWDKVGKKAHHVWFGDYHA
jgi:TPR repeat protein/plasmid maintenance system killer protein